MNWIQIPGSITILHSPVIIGNSYMIANSIDWDNKCYEWVPHLNQLALAHFDNNNQVSCCNVNPIILTREIGLLKNAKLIYYA